MERRKAPVHDFAPSWLRINSYDKDLNTSNNNRLDNKRPTSSGLGGVQDSFDLRPQYLKQRDSNTKDPITSSSSHTNLQKPGTLLTSSQVNTPFDFETDRAGEEASRSKGWLTSTSNTNNSNSWSSSRRFNPKAKPPGNSATSPGTIEDSASNTRRTSTSLRSNDVGIVNISGTGREDVTKSNGGYPNHHQNHPHSFHHHGNNKARLSGSMRGESPPISGEVVGESIKGKSNTKNGFVDSNKFKEEFPSLIDEKQVNVETNNGHNVWDNVANKVFRSSSSKVSLVSRHLGSSLFEDKGSLALNGEKSLNGTGFFRSLVPVVPRRKTVNGINGSSSGSKENATLVNSLSNLSLGSTNKILPVFAKPSNHPSAGHSMAILVKKHPKMRSNKNDFMLPNMRSSSSDSRPDTHDEQRSNDPFDEEYERANNSCFEDNNGEDTDEKIKDEESHEGGDMNNRHDDADVHLLSSSLEAEERLLREMGWKEDDGDDNFYAPLTEDEVNEFKDLINTRTSLKRHINPKINRGQFKFQVNSNQLPLSQLNFLNSLATEDQDKDETDSTSEEDDDDSDDNDAS